MKQRIIPKNAWLPFLLLTGLFFAWAIPNNLTDTMLAAFKRIYRCLRLDGYYGLYVVDVSHDLRNGN